MFGFTANFGGYTHPNGYRVGLISNLGSYSYQPACVISWTSVASGLTPLTDFLNDDFKEDDTPS